MAGFVIQHLELSPTSYYGGPVSGWVTVIGSAVHYSTEPDAQAVIDEKRMYAVVNTDPPTMFGDVVGPASAVDENIAVFDGLTGKLIKDGGSSDFGLIGVQTFAVPGNFTYHKSAGTRRVYVEIQGGGGGGGGAVSPGAGDISAASGGGGGGYVGILLQSDFDNAPIVVGDRGDGGAAGNNPGTNGGDSSFTQPVGVVTYTGSGGVGGTAGTAVTPPSTTDSVAGGAASAASVTLPGQRSQFGYNISTSACTAGSGGTSYLGRFGTGGRVSVAGTANTGAAASGKGAGGGGGISSSGGGDAAGGNGSEGIVKVWEFGQA